MSNLDTLPVASGDAQPAPVQSQSRVRQWMSNSDQVSRIMWGLILGFCFILAWVMKAYAGDILKEVPAFQLCTTDTCAGKIVVFRISFVLTVFYAVFAIMMLGYSPESSSDDIRGSCQLSYWILKFLAVIGGLIITFFIPNPFFVVFAQISQYFAGLFILIQIILLVDFAYAWNESWVAKEYFKGIIGVSFCLYAGTIAMVVVSSILFTTNAGCGMNTAFIVVTAILVVIVTVVSLRVEHGAILTSSVVCVYASYLCISSMMSEPADFPCNTLKGGDSVTGTIITIIGLLLMGVALVYSAMNAASSSDAFIISGSGNSDQYAGVNDDGSPAAAGETKRKVSKYSYTFFHLVFCLASMYMANVLVGWEISETSALVDIDVGWVSVWIKIVAQWVTFLLYGWSLMAPICLPNRDFS